GLRIVTQAARPGSERMLTHRWAVHLSVLAGLLFLIGQGGRPFSAPTIAHAQGISSSSQRPAQPPAAAAKPAGRQLYRQHCQKCHEADGTGRAARRPMPEIPDFTNTSWQARRSDAQLTTSILDGKGDDMPPFRRKIRKEQARGLVAHVRAFAPTRGKPGKAK